MTITWVFLASCTDRPCGVSSCLSNKYYWFTSYWWISSVDARRDRSTAYLKLLYCLLTSYGQRILIRLLPILKHTILLVYGTNFIEWVGTSQNKLPWIRMDNIVIVNFCWLLCLTFVWWRRRRRWMMMVMMATMLMNYDDGDDDDDDYYDDADNDDDGLKNTNIKKLVKIIIIKC